MEGPAPIGEHGRSSRPCMNNSTKQVLHYGGWPLAIPTWEKEFCFEVGSFTWNDFLEAKAKSLISSAAEKVIGWYDSSVEDAFNNAKKRFFANKFSYDVPVDPMMNYRLPSPDLYINLIEWDEDDDDNFDSSDEEDQYSDIMHTVWKVLQALEIGF